MIKMHASQLLLAHCRINNFFGFELENCCFLNFAAESTIVFRACSYTTVYSHAYFISVITVTCLHCLFRN